MRRAMLGGGSSNSTTGAKSATPAADAPMELVKISQKSLYLALYAKVLSGEKHKHEDAEMIMGPQDQGNNVNKQLLVVGRILSTWFDQRAAAAAANGDEDDESALAGQGWLEYLYGLVLAKEKNDDKAIEYLVRSVHLYPWNWACWLELTNIMGRIEDLNRISRHLPQNIVSFMFHLHTSLELYQQGPDLANSLDQLLGIFPTSPFLLTCTAMLSYHAKDLFAAEQHFSRLLSLAPAPAGRARPLLQHPLCHEPPAQAGLPGPPLLERRQVPARVVRRHRQLLLPALYAREGGAVLSAVP